MDTNRYRSIVFNFAPDKPRSDYPIFMVSYDIDFGNPDRPLLYGNKHSPTKYVINGVVAPLYSKRNTMYRHLLDMFKYDPEDPELKPHRVLEGLRYKHDRDEGGIKKVYVTYDSTTVPIMAHRTMAYSYITMFSKRDVSLVLPDIIINPEFIGILPSEEAEELRPRIRFISFNNSLE